jgi:pimeloyl-ACP methyl ester carboxylesterase
MNPPRSGSVASAPQLHYLEWQGRGTGTVVLVHGNSANAWWWRWTVEAMAGDYARVVAMDLRGHGDSAWVKPPDYSPTVYGEDIARLLEARALDRPVVVGHSMGGVATLAFAQRFPALARAVVAIDVAVTSSARRNRYLRHLKALPTVVYPDRATALGKFRLMPAEGEISPAILAAIAEQSLTRTASGGYTMKFDRESFFGSDGLDVADAVRQIRIPFLLIRAGLSRILTAEAAAAATASNPLVQLITLPGAHHHLPLERPAELAAAILGFARTQYPSSD